ncbi:MAG: SIS domain-containing protein [Elusimicrobia bacterium]|nr:SIS domain-containing protein [Elusimicrobiota bacterium]
MKRRTPDSSVGKRSFPTLIISAQLRESSRVLAATAGQAPEIARAASILLAALRKGRRIITFGNGGSACDAQNFAAELVGRYARNRPPIDAVALTVNTSNLTAIANDFGYEEVFRRQLAALGRAGDAAVAISTSGDSPNVLLAVSAARRMGIRTIGLAGARGGKLKALVDVCVRVPSDTVARIQEAHITILQIWASIIEDALYPISRASHTGRRALRGPAGSRNSP